MASLNNPNSKCRRSPYSNTSSADSINCDDWQSTHGANIDRNSNISNACSKITRFADSDYLELFEKCDYVESHKHSWFKNKKTNDLFLIHFNIRSLQKHIDELATYLAGFKNQPEIVAISETKLREGNVNRNINLEGYSFVHSDSKTCAGGVRIYIKNTQKCSVNLHSKIVIINAEHLWIDILGDNALIIHWRGM